jgi:hypothetical protein
VESGRYLDAMNEWLGRMEKLPIAVHNNPIKK